jgi:hypothetical protein
MGYAECHECVTFLPAVNEFLLVILSVELSEEGTEYSHRIVIKYSCSRYSV